MIPARDDRGGLKVRGMWGGKWNKNPNARAIIFAQLYEPAANEKWLNNIVCSQYQAYYDRMYGDR